MINTTVQEKGLSLPEGPLYKCLEVNIEMVEAVQEKIYFSIAH